MAFFHLRELEVNSWPIVPDAKFGQMWSTYLTLGRTQWLPPGEIERFQLTQVRNLLTHCKKRVPYYREMFEKLGVEPQSIRTMDDFRRVPLHNRRTWQENYERLHAEELPVGITLMSEVKSSGTSGVPVRVLKTSLCQIWSVAFYLRSLEWINVDIRGTLAILRPSYTKGEELKLHLAGIQVPHWLPPIDPYVQSGPVFSMDLLQDPRRQIQYLSEVNPDYLLGYPSNLEALAGILLDNPRSFPRLKSIQSISEYLTDEAASKIEKAFNAPIFNIYSCVEAGYLASPCPKGHGLHVHAENVLLELLDNSGQPAQPGTPGRVVMTDLHNSASPVIRYEIGDEVVQSATPCPCGRGLPLLTKIVGKERPMMRLRDGRKKHSSPLAQAISALGGHYQHQIIQKAIDRVVVRLVPNKSYSPDTPRKVLKAIEDFFESPMHVNLELRDFLEIPPNGKLLCIISEVPD
jgi:phenylacetate-CoA ligase